jgi:hypothetical protein
LSGRIASDLPLDFRIFRLGSRVFLQWLADVLVRVPNQRSTLSTSPTSRLAVRFVIPRDGELRAEARSRESERYVLEATTPPVRSLSLSAKQVRAIVVSVCLADTLRSQSFSPSQRLNPARTLWLYFAPHPPIGFVAFRVFPTQSAFTPLDDPYSLAVKQ